MIKWLTENVFLVVTLLVVCYIMGKAIKAFRKRNYREGHRQVALAISAIVLYLMSVYFKKS